MTPANALFFPNYANANLSKDFFIDGPPGNFVPVQISVTYDYQNLFVLAVSYTVQSSAALRVRDLTTDRDVATHPLLETSRDQGIDLSAAGGSTERQVLNEANASFIVMLRRGHDYRLFLEVEAMAQVPIAGFVEANAQISWREVSVRVDEDEVELLEGSDHDEIIALLEELKMGQAELKDGQREIIRLLLTPQGQRDSDFGDCVAQSCDFPLKPDSRGNGRGNGRSRRPF